MYTGYAVPFKPLKNEAFTLVSQLWANTTPPSVAFDLSDPTWKTYISKDGGAFAATTNSPTEIDKTVDTSFARGFMKLDLTAEEMNADIISVIVVARNTADNGFDSVRQAFVIYTSGFDGFDSGVDGDAGIKNFKSAFLNILTTGIQNDFDLVDVAIDENSYNYYGLRKNNNEYLIVKEPQGTGDQSYSYRSLNNGKKYNNAWDTRTIIAYSSTQNII